MKKTNFLLMAIILLSIASLLGSFVVAFKDNSITGNVIEDPLNNLTKEINNSLIDFSQLQKTESQIKELLRNKQDSYQELSNLMYGLGDVFGTAYPESEFKPYFYNEAQKLSIRSQQTQYTQEDLENSLAELKKMQKQLEEVNNELNKIHFEIKENKKQESAISPITYFLIAINFLVLIISIVLAKDQIVNVNIFHTLDKNKS